MIYASYPQESELHDYVTSDACTAWVNTPHIWDIVACGLRVAMPIVGVRPTLVRDPLAPLAPLARSPRSLKTPYQQGFARATVMTSQFPRFL